MMRGAVRVAVLPLLLVASVRHAGAAPDFTLRMATVAPDGSTWARELKEFGREILDATNGSVAVKWYFGAIAGEEVRVEERIRKQQLDGTASGGMLCEKLAPSFRGIRMLGLYRNADEVSFVYGQLRPQFDIEFRKQGFVNVAEGLLGSVAVFSRQPIDSLANLKAHKLWHWDQDEPQGLIMDAMGLSTQPLALDRASRAYDQGAIDGFYSIPGAALAFQWSAQARYVMDLKADYLVGCVIIADRAYDRLPLRFQEAVRAAGARLHARWEDTVRRQDDALMSGLFEHQGLRKVPISEQLRKEFFESARAAREQLGAKLIPPLLMKRVFELLSEYRTQHPSVATARGGTR